MSEPDPPLDDTTTHDAGTGRVAAGILVADRSSRTTLERRRRWLVSGGALGLVLLLALVGGRTMLQQQANQRAAEQSARSDARTALAAAVIDQAQAHRDPTRSIDTDALSLRLALEEHLAVSARDDAQVDAARDDALASLRADAVSLAVVTERDAPIPDDLIAASRSAVVLQELETLRAEASALAEEVIAAADGAEVWSVAVRDLEGALATYVALVEGESSTSDPDRLIEQWQAELPALRDLDASARRAAQVPGLSTWATAHVEYAEAVTAWVDEAVGYLEVLDVDRYNDRFDELFGVDDPFGFVAAASAGAEDALSSPAIENLETVRARASLVIESVTTLEQLVIEQLRDDPSEEASEPR